jgi:hypothetical protein
VSQRVEALRKAAHEFYKEHRKWPEGVRMHPLFLMHLKHESGIWSWTNIGHADGPSFEGMTVTVTRDVHAFEVRASADRGTGT